MSTKLFRPIGLVGIVVVAVAILAFCLLAENASAAEDTWRARYWNNTKLSGNALVDRREAAVNYDWGTNSPIPGLVNPDNFSARWGRTAYFDGGTYRFTARVDDGIRVWVDDSLIIDSWIDSPVRTLSAERSLGTGDHRVKVEYYDRGHLAVAQVSWQKIGGSGVFNGWRGEYFSNPNLAEGAVLVRDDANINFDWGDGSAIPGLLAPDRFSVRWTRNANFAAGRYRFTTTTDDGVRLWVNGVLIIDRWYDQTSTTHAADIDLPNGSIPIKMEYYDNLGGARAFLSWTPLSAAPIVNWRGEYYQNASLSGGPMLIRDDAAIDFNWGEGAPASGFDRDNFSVRWTRSLVFQPGRWRFTTRTDDGVRLWVNNQLVIDRWTPQTLTTYSAEVDLLGGPASITMEYFERSGFAEAHLSWERLTNPPTGTGGVGTATVTTGRLNVRSGPGTAHTILTTVDQGTTLNLLGYRNAEGNWIMVGLASGTQGWVHAGYVRTSVPVNSLAVWNEGSSGGQPPSSGPSATVTAYHLNVRTGPGIGNSIITTIDRGTNLSLTHRNPEGSWVRVILPNGAQGWVHAGNIRSSVPINSLPIWR
jgi:uncharacterized protein YraI